MGIVTQAFASGDPRIDGLLSGRKWLDTIKVGFPDQASDYPGLNSSDERSSDFGAASSELQRVFTYLTTLVSGYTGLGFDFRGGVAADISAAYTSAVTSANPARTVWNVAGNLASADIWFGTSFNFRAPKVGDYAYLTVLHELGHALGLKHPFEAGGAANTVLPAMWDWLGYSVMSYRSYQGDDLSGYSNETFGYPTTFMANDILALQEMYGANYETNGGDTVYTWNSGTGQSFVNGVAGPKPGDGLGATFDSSMNRVFMALWDGGGEDTLDLSNFANGMFVDLSPGAGSRFTNAPNLGNGRSANNLYMSWLVDGDPRSLIENAVGGAGADRLLGNSANNKLTGNGGNDVLHGGAGDDLLTGGAGTDQLVGGVGQDTANYSSPFASVVIDYFTRQTKSDPSNGLASLVIKGGDGQDGVDVEQLRFTDRTIDVADYLSYDPNPPRLLASFDNRVFPSTTAAYASELSLTFTERVTLVGGNLRVYYADGALYKTYALADVFTDSHYQELRFVQPKEDGQYYVEIDPGSFVDAAGNPFAGLKGPSAMNFIIGAVDDYPDLPAIDKYTGSVASSPKTIDVRTITDPVTISGYIDPSSGDTQDFQKILFDPNKIYLITNNTVGANGLADGLVFIDSVQRDSWLGTQWLYEIRPQTTVAGQVLFKLSSGERWIGGGSASGAYSFTIREWPYGDDAINDFYSGTPPQNSKVPIGGSLQGILYSSGSTSTKDSVGRDLDDARGDTDWLQVDLVAGQTYRFQIEAGASTYAGFDVTGQIGMRLYRNYEASAAVYGGAYQELPAFLASTVTPAVFTKAGLTTSAGASQFEFTATETGTHWLRVVGYGGSPSGYGVAGPYTVSFATKASDLVPLLTPPTLVTSEVSFADGGQAFAFTFSEAIRAGAGFVRITLDDFEVETVDIRDTTRVSINGNSLTVRAAADNLLIGQVQLSLTSGTVLDKQGAQAAPLSGVPLAVSQARTSTNDTAGTVATAATISVGERVSETLTSLSDADWFKITMAAGVAYDIAAMLPSTTTTTAIRVAVRNSAGTLIVEDKPTAAGNTKASLVFTPSVAGTYFIEVGGYSQGNYTLQVLSFDAGIQHSGTSSSEYLSGTAFADVLKGGAGGDLIDARGGDDSLLGEAGDDLLAGGPGRDTLTGGTGDDTIDGGSNIDTAVFAGNRSAYTVTQFAAGQFRVTGPDGTDRLINVEFLQFADQKIKLYPGTATAVNFAADDPGTYMAAIRDFDGNDVGASADWQRIGAADVNGDGDLDQIFVNRTNGRFAEVATAPDGKVYFGDHGWAGETRVVGIYIDPLVQSGQVQAGGDFDSQRRFQNDLRIGNIAGVLGAGEYDRDGLQEVYFKLTDGTAYLHAYMHADGNIRYANYQSQQQVIDFLTQNGWASSTHQGWFA